MSKDLNLKATPEKEDFGHKYTEEGQGKIGSKLLDGYFLAVESLLNKSGKLQSKKPLKVVELGCGEGYSTARLHKMLPESAQFSASEYVGKLVPKAQELNPKVKVIEESVYELTHKDKTFDVVFLLEVLEHLDYPDKALEEIGRVLKDDGVLILGVPREPLWRMLNMARGKYLKDFGNTIGHLNHWSARGLVEYTSKHFGTVVAKENPLPWTLVLLKKDKGKKIANHSQEAEGKLSPYLGVQRYKNVAKHIQINDTVLDIGSGSGQLREYLPKGARYFGIDSAKQWSGESDYLFKVKVGDGLPKKLKSENFTAITALAVIEHLKEPAQLFVDAGALLDVGGRFIVTTPHPIGEKVHTMGAKTGLFSSHAHDEHEDLLDKNDLRRLGEENGFEMVRYNRFLFGMNQVAVFTKK